MADETPVTGAAEPDLLALGGMEASLGAFANMAQAQKTVPAAAQAPSAMKQVQDAAEAKAREGQGFFDSVKNKDKYGGEGIPFTAGRGPVSVVGITGVGVNPPKPEKGGFTPGGADDISGLTALVKQARQWVTTHRGRLVQVATPEVEGGKHPQIYGSSDGAPVPGGATFSSKSAEEIARDQFRLIEKTVGDGSGLKANEQYRLLLIGHSWGGDKAVEVANLLGDALAHDPHLGPLYAKDKIQIHLVTLDAIGQRTDFPPGDQASKRVIWSSVRIASWLNIPQTKDTGLPPFPPLKGGDFPGSLDHNLTQKELDSIFNGKATNGLHATVPMYVVPAVRNHLYPRRP